MTGEELVTIRKDIGLSQGEFLQALGMIPLVCQTDDERIRRMNAKSKLRKWEMPEAIVPADVAEKATDLWLRRGGCGS